MTIDYAEERGIWHRVRDGKTLCGREVTSQVQRFDFTPKPLCWRCREAT